VGYALSVLEDKIGGPPAEGQSKPQGGNPVPRKWIMCVAPTSGEQCPCAVVDTGWANFCCLGIMKTGQFPVLNHTMYAEQLKSAFTRAAAQFSYSLEIVQAQCNMGQHLTGQMNSITHVDAVEQKKDPDWKKPPTPKKKAARQAPDPSSPTSTPDSKKVKTSDQSSTSSSQSSGRKGIPAKEMPKENPKEKEDVPEEAPSDQSDDEDNTRITRGAKNKDKKVGKAKAKANRDAKPAKLKPAGLSRLSLSGQK
jgi:hypothetical protein